MTLRRMNAYRLVLATAALTVFVTAALATALASFAGAALPQAAHRELAAAPGTALDITGSVTGGQVGRYQAGLQAAIRSGLPGVPVTLHQSVWSDPLRLAAAGPALARLTGKGNVLLTQAAAFGAIQSHAVLVSGRWPAAPRPGQPVQAALPQAAALLAHLSPGAQLQTRDQVSGRPARFLVTGIFRPETSTPAAAGYWALNTIGASGTSTSGGFTTVGPLAVSPAAFHGPLSVNAASWVAQPDTSRIPAGQLTATATRAAALRQGLANSGSLSGLQVSTNLPAVLDSAAASLAVARSLLVIGALELALVAAAALATAAAYLADQREGEVGPARLAGHRPGPAGPAERGRGGHPVPDRHRGRRAGRQPAGHGAGLGRAAARGRAAAARVPTRRLAGAGRDRGRVHPGAALAHAAHPGPGHRAAAPRPPGGGLRHRPGRR